MDCIVDGNSLWMWKTRFERYSDRRIRINYDKLFELLPKDVKRTFLIIKTNPRHGKQQNFFKGIRDSGLYELIHYSHHMPSPSAIIGNLMRSKDQYVVTSDCNIIPVASYIKSTIVTARKFCPEITNMFLRDVNAIFIDDDIDDIFEDI